jgi:hypothetical protein
MSAIKAKEKEMKDEKEAERQVSMDFQKAVAWKLTFTVAADTGAQGQAC